MINITSRFDAAHVTPHKCNMRRPYFIPLYAFAAMPACTSLVTAPPQIAPSDIQAEFTSQAINAAKRQQGYIKRLSDVAGPIMTANAELCPRTRPYYGLSTHSEKSYSKHIRSAVQSELNINQDHVISHVVSGSPADQAAIRPGDVIITDDGLTVSARALRKQDIAPHGRAVLKIKRAEQVFDVTVETVASCDYALGIRHTSAINAIATGRSITVTTGMINFTQSDAELAAIIGHELAHNTLGHIRKAVTNYIVTAGHTRFTRPFETEADYAGLYYAARAGYDIENVENFWRRLGQESPTSVGRAKTHPTTPDRFLSLKATYQEIEAKRAAGLALIPNFKDAAPKSP